MATTPYQSTETGCSFFWSTPERVFSVEEFSSDERLMVEMAEQFSRKEILPIQDRLDAKEDGLMVSLLRKAGELGFCGPDTPAEYGGLGLGKNISARILEFLSLNASFSVTVGVTSGIGQLGLTLFGSEAQKQKYLPNLASGQWIGAYALSEPNSGSDALSLVTRAEEKGDKWVLNGTKMWISNAMWADLFVVMAKVNGDQVTAFLVERGFPGVSVSREEHKLGLHGSSTARLVLENAEVPKENVLHVIGKGHHVAFNALNIGRYKLAAMSLGPAREAIYQCTGYVQERKQFGQAIGEFGLIRKKLADMACWYFGAESALYRTGANIDSAFAQHGSSVDGNKRAAEEFSVECGAVKVLASEAEWRIADEALQCYGGYGYTEEFPLARIYRDARISRIYEGTNEINRTFIAGRLKHKAEGRACCADSFVSELAGRALAVEAGGQERVGAQSDLLMLAYAEQSARLRAKQAGRITQAAYERFRDWANVQAASAFQRATGEAVSLPAPSSGHTDVLAEALMEKRAPV
ncbi:MAG TPA: acyl-CoA dehydrogenase family protein [Fimbriimonadaceae bacterium]|nr:acyl-CoA dehydrogenase family protein [Fimbriimonadaceae bacterium]